MNFRTLPRLLMVLSTVVTVVSISGCVAPVAYCMAKYNEAICGKGDPEWGAGTDIPFYGTEFQSRFKRFGLTSWHIAVDSVIASGGPGHAIFQNKQPDFKWQMKYRVEGDARVALAVRAENEVNITTSNAYLITLADGADNSTVGSVSGLTKPEIAPGTGWGQQEVQIIVSGSRLVVSVNGKVISDSVINRTADGFIAVTFHPGASGAGRFHLLEARRRWCSRANPCL